MIKGSKHTLESIEKMKLVHIGLRHPVNFETRAKMRAVALGRKVSEEHRKNISIALTGRHLSEQHKINIGKASKNHVVSIEARKRISEKHKGNKNHFYGVFGEKHPRWRGGVYSKCGYEVIKVHPMFYIAVHRKTMEKMLGRKLHKGEIVHHINKTKKDNRQENLALCSDFSAHRWCHSEEAKMFFGGLT